MSAWRAELVKMQESIDRIGDALVTAEKNIDVLEKDHFQLKTWHIQSITYAENVKIAENALAKERAAHQETRAQLKVLTDLANGWKPSRIMRDLAENNERAKKKHGPHANIMVTLGVLSQEMHELQEAVHSREDAMIRAELIDIATGALRGVEALDARVAERNAKLAEQVKLIDADHDETPF